MCTTYIHMCNTIFACFCPSESINNKYDGAQSRRLLLQFYSLIRNLCWLWFSCSFRLFLLFLNPNHSFVFNRMVHTRTDIRQINKIWYILLGRMHINTGCRDWAVKDKERSYKVSQAPCTKTDFCKHHLPVSQHLGNVRQIRTLRSLKWLVKSTALKETRSRTLCRALLAIKWRK